MIPHPRSCGILLYRRVAGATELWLGHMGGPLWARKDAAAWSIPKGEPHPDEDDLDAARREFLEEIGIPAPDEPYEHLGDYRYASGKVVTVFAAETAANLAFAGSNDFEMEWPPRSGLIGRFPEIDRATWVTVAEAPDKLVKGQRPMVAALALRLND